MRKGFACFGRKRRNILGAVFIAVGLLITLICVPFWAFMALVGAAVMVVGAYCLLRR